MKKVFNEVDCDICKFKYEDKPVYGEFIRGEKLDVHYYCLLSGTEIPQKGSSKQGIHGFLEKDVEKSFEKFKQRQCFVCKQKHAAVKCAFKDCDRAWHYPCGRRANCITQFIGKFESFCNRHPPEQNLLRHDGFVYCFVCYMLISTNHPATCILSKCCADSPNYYPDTSLEEIKLECFTHAACVQRYTVNGGYDANCINCNMKGMTKDEWQKQMRLRGIFIPQKMASWEEDGYFDDQTKQKCTLESCKNPELKRNVYTCYVCGCFPRHLKCAGVQSHDEYYCPKCYGQSFIKLLPSTSKKQKK